MNKTLVVVLALAALTPGLAQPGLPAPDPYAAVGHLRCGEDAPTCGSATVLGPRRADGRWHVLTALHNLSQPQGEMTLRSGLVLAVREVARDVAADLAVLVTERSDLATLPFAWLAESDPRPGARVWQAGWGVRRPGVRKEGVILGGPVPMVGVSVAQGGYLTLEIETSMGDSGGGYFDEAGRLVAVVSKKGIERPLICYGGAASVARRLLEGVR